uniref:MATA-HMG n=1 Tax=Rhizophagus irregularis (strain DAOM 181602 / DAOM 197198 / MUCL 43194) TaxID=747089 RepID=U9TU05_RHIID
MKDISSMVSQSWEQEPEEIKNYKRLANNKINGILLQNLIASNELSLNILNEQLL